MPNNIPYNPNMYRSNINNLLNQYLSNIAVEITKLYNFHWNVKDPMFTILHKETENYYTKLQEMYDETAERIKMLNGYPITLLEEYAKISTIKSIESKNYNSEIIIRTIVNDFELLLSLSQEIGNMATQVNDMGTIDLVTNHISFLEKQLWMLKSQLNK